MSLISKICVLFLVYLAMGYIATWIVFAKSYLKLYKIDPNNEELVDEMLEVACNLTPLLNGVEIKDKNQEEINDQFDQRLGSNQVTRLFKYLIVWPKALAEVEPYLQEAERQIHDEYDRGIRTRKEPS